MHLVKCLEHFNIPTILVQGTTGDQDHYHQECGLGSPYLTLPYLTVVGFEVGL